MCLNFAVIKIFIKLFVFKSLGKSQIEAIFFKYR